jgi:hypothetical protein
VGVEGFVGSGDVGAGEATQAIAASQTVAAAQSAVRHVR